MASFLCGLTVLDADGHTSSVGIRLTAADFASATADIQALVAEIDTLILGKITGNTVTQDVALPGGLKATPVAGSDNEIKGRWIFGTAGAYRLRISLPSFDKDSFTVIGGDINAADVDVLAFTNLMLSAGWADSRYDDITSVLKGYEAFGR